jgi:hypothetical protein
VAEQPFRLSLQPAISLAARLRVTLGFVFGAIVFWLAEPNRHTLIIGGALAGVGEGLRLWAAGHLHKSREVTVSGPYRWTAHPLYVGSSIMGLGLALAANRVSVAILIASYLALTITAAIKSEEAFLRRTFGDHYGRYLRGEAAQSAADEPRTGHQFSLTQVIANHEERALAGLLLAMVLLALKARYRV